MLRQYELVDLVRSYDPDADEALLNKAYVFATKAHGQQKRYSGDPFFSHPIEVAGILTQLKLDAATIVTALLHDTIEDTQVSYDDIKEHFGEEIADLVDGVTKLSNIHFTDHQIKQAENFRKFFLATSKDVRVLLVKLADRLHNMRTISHIPDEEKRKAIAKETLEIYAPLAGRIGMQGFRDEFEDRSFAELFPDARESVVKRLDYLNEESGDKTETITQEIEEILKAAGIDAIVYGRRKRPFSVWRKMELKDISFEQLSDIVGFRVIVDTKADCYTALGAVHSKWSMVPGGFKDYISTPKRNGYQSIHTTIYGPDEQRVELQIRTKEMHEVAETGVAAHWDYKEQTYKIGADKGKARHMAAMRTTSRKLRENLFRDLRGLADLFHDEESSEVFLEHTKMEMYSDQVFVFTPKGDLINLPHGATAIDFAYAVHTTIGDTCVGAKINGRYRPLRTRLGNGDSVEILCSKAQTPTPEWESYVVTGRARSAIRRHVRQTRRKEFIAMGENILNSLLHKRELQLTESGLNEAIAKLNLSSTDELYVQVGEGSITSDEVLEAIFPGIGAAGARSGLRRLVSPFKLIRPRRSGASGDKVALPLKGITPGHAIHLAGCCHPLPGDRVVGIRMAEKGVVVHTIDCAAIDRHRDSPWLDLKWDMEPGQKITAVGRLMTHTPNEPGVLGEIATVIAKQDGNITNVRFAAQDERSAQLEVDIAVADVRHLEAIISALRASPVVNSVERVRGEDNDEA